MSKIPLFSIVLLIGCQSGAGYLDGVGFEVNDAIFERATLFDGTKQITKILVSDAVDLCERLSSGDTLAGHSELAIKRWESGSVNVALFQYGSECEVMETERASQGWVEDQSDDPWQADFDVVFQTQARSVSGRLVADFCPLPEDARIGCN